MDRVWFSEPEVGSVETVDRKINENVSFKVNQINKGEAGVADF